MGLFVGSVLLGGEVCQPASLPAVLLADMLSCQALCSGCAEARLSNLTRSCTVPGNTPGSTSKLTAFGLCPSATTDLSMAA